MKFNHCDAMVGLASIVHVLHAGKSYTLKNSLPSFAISTRRRRPIAATKNLELRYLKRGRSKRMSWEALGWIAAESKTRGSTYLFFLVVGNELDSDGKGEEPTVTKLMRKARLPKRTVQRALKRIVALGELRRVRQGDGRQKSFWEIPGMNGYHPKKRLSRGELVAIPGDGEGRQNDTPQGRQNDTPQGRQNDTPQGRQNDTPGASNRHPSGDEMTPLSSPKYSKQELAPPPPPGAAAGNGDGLLVVVEPRTEEESEDKANLSKWLSEWPISLIRKSQEELFAACRRRVPNCTFRAIHRACLAKLEGANVKNPAGLLIATVPDFLADLYERKTHESQKA
jgi:hypothetical protein